MARRRSRPSVDEVQRDINPSLTSLLDDSVLSPPVLSPVVLPDPVPFSALREIEDLREYDPDPSSPANTIAGAADIGEVYAPPVYRKTPQKLSMPRGQRAFANPERVAVCVRRHQRREVLFALRRTRGRGGARRRNRFSNIRC